MYVFGHVVDIKDAKFPNEVLTKLYGYLEILDENYGERRNIQKDLGGYAIIPESVSDIETIKQEIIKGTIPEDVEVIKCGEGQVYCSSLFILSSDYAVIVVATKDLTDLLFGE